ncbi:MAG TPA: hypothetical protein VN326_15100 [Casimicrobiaceae bacterium]|jgi:hypothetical protein|nr:hypothetical protein [Casimicrobiaceae bacterium]
MSAIASSVPSAPNPFVRPHLSPKTDQAIAVDLEHLQELARFIVECHSQAIATTNADGDAVIVVEIDTT